MLEFFHYTSDIQRFPAHMALEKSVNIRAIQRYNCKQSSCLDIGGFIISAFSYNIYVLFVTFGVMCGTAQSLSIVGGASILYYYFEEKRGLATSKSILILRISITLCLWELKCNISLRNERHFGIRCTEHQGGDIRLNAFINAAFKSVNICLTCLD